jgi:predicted extracellular nuclease
MKRTITFLGTLLIANISVSQCTDLFFSEYVEGTSNNKLIEIYNPTSAAINLADYKVFRHNSAAVLASDSLALTGMLNSGDVYVIGNPYGGQGVTAISDVTDDITFYGGDDALTLKKISTNTIIDKIGEVSGTDPGSNWTVGSGSTEDYTLVRKISVKEGNTNWAVAATEWNVLPLDVLDSIGAHTMTPCGSTSIESNDISSLVSVYPNPTNGLVNVSLGNSYVSVKASVFNSVGKLISSQNFVSTAKVVLNITEPKGFYFVKIATENGNTAMIKVAKN